MGVFIFLPWCRLESRVDLADIEIIPYRSNQPIDGLTDEEEHNVKSILSLFKNIEGKPVERAAFVKFTDRSPVCSYLDEDYDYVTDSVSLACFASLANRQYMGESDNYCCSDNFSPNFIEISNKSSRAFVTRRRDGNHTSSWSLKILSHSEPIHSHANTKIAVEESLLKSLLRCRQKEAEENGKWGQWQYAISCFNQANTDSPRVTEQVEFVLLASAFEQILGADSKAIDVAEKLNRNLIPNYELFGLFGRRSSEKYDKKLWRTIRYEWMKEFYRIRGDFAHGKLAVNQPMAWQPKEHLLLATISFPLVAKTRLASSNLYELSEKDRIQIDCFESLADQPDFLQPPHYNAGSHDSFWNRLRKRRFEEILFREPLEDYFNNLSDEELRKLEFHCRWNENSKQ